MFKCLRLRQVSILLISILFMNQFNWNFSNSERLEDNATDSEIKNSTKGQVSEHIARLEMEQFLLEMDDFIREEQNEAEGHGGSHGRVKRTVIFNSAAPLDVVIVFGIPITVILPVLTNIFTNLNWSKIFKWKRSIEDDDEDQYIDESILVQPHVDKISGYFELLRMPEKSCQQRAVCEFSANPDKYYPVSELVLNRIRSPSLPPLEYLDDNEQFLPIVRQNQNNSIANSTIKNTQNPRKPKSLFQMFTNAADKGLAYGQNVCLHDFADTCPYSIEDRLNMPALQFWNLLSSLLKFNIKDDVISSF